jgi:PAS domain S-box-containing protein
MDLLAFLRLFLLLLAAVGFFIVLRALIVKHALKGFQLIAVGFALVYLNIVVGSLFHSDLLPQEWNAHVLPNVGFITGYFGQTLGLFFLLLGNYRLVRSLVPHLSAHYSSLVEKSLVGVYLIQDGVFKFVNPRLAEIFGYQREEITGNAIELLIAPESRSTVIENIRKRVTGKEEALHYAFTGQKKDGTKIQVEVYGSRTMYEGKPAVHGTLLDITERKHAEEVLRESETRFRTVVENLGEGLVITDENDKVLYINSRMAELSGYTAEEMIGQTAYTFLLPPSEWQLLKDRNKERMRGKVERYEILVMRKDGSRFWTEINATPYRDTNGKIIGTLGAVTDIQERKRAQTLQSALYRIAEKTHSSIDLQEFYGSVHRIISELMSAKNFYISLYDSSNRMLSFPYFVDEVDPPPQPKKIGKGLTDYVLRTGQPLLASPDVFERLLRTGEVESIGAPSIDWLGVPLKSGETIFGAIVVQSYSDTIRYGKKEKEILTFVSQHIATAIQRKADEERFRAVWEHSADGMRLTDKEGKIVMVNSAFCKIIKLPHEKLVGKFLSAMYRGEEEETTLKLYRERFEVESVVERFTGNITLWNGEEVPVEISNSFIRFGMNNKMLLSVFRDISERKILQDQLIHAQKMESIGLLAGGIAHDFNNVLSMILTSAEMLKEKTQNDKTLQHYADMVATAAERGASIAKQLLLFSRSEKGRLKPISLSPVVLEVQKLLEHTLPKSIAIKSEIESGSAMVMGDSDQLHQALLNLALNARDAIEAKSNHGTIVFRVATAAHDKLGTTIPYSQKENCVALSVSDNGIGMSEETRRRIFDPFFSTKERGKGTGLGLSIVHGIVQNHQGVIDVQSSREKGTTMTFYFPLVTVDQKESVGDEKKKSPRPTAQESRTPTILVVDDEQLLREMLTEILEERNYKVIAASNGVDAVQKYQLHRDQINMVISDLGMPLMGGEEVFKKLREINPDVKMVFVTGYLEENSKNGASYFGVKDIIQKPFHIEEIAACVSHVLKE